MIDFCSYNIRGLNNKVHFVKNFLIENKISFIGLLETRVKKDVAKIISSEIDRSFCWIDNMIVMLGAAFGLDGTRSFGTLRLYLSLPNRLLVLRPTSTIMLVFSSLLSMVFTRDLIGSSSGMTLVFYRGLLALMLG